MYKDNENYIFEFKGKYKDNEEYISKVKKYQNRKVIRFRMYFRTKIEQYGKELRLCKKLKQKELNTNNN